MESHTKKISILVPVFNEGTGVEALYEALQPLISNKLTSRDYEWEVLMVDDGSSDDSLDRMRRLHEADQRVRYVSLSRNFGKENAMLAGMDHVAGQCAVIMDADLQHPVATIPEMIEKWEEGYDDVYCRRVTRGREPWMRRVLTKMYYGMLRRISSKVQILPNVGDFRLLDRRVVQAMRSLRETQRYTKGLYCWVGFKKASVDFEQADGVRGKSTFGLWSLLNLAIEGITSYTTAPLRIASVTGILISLCSLVYMIYIVAKTILVGEPIQGFPTLVCVMLLLGGAQLLAIGIIGEYLSRVFVQTKGRPPYIVSEIDGEKV